jgi:hypothetical protein
MALCLILYSLKNQEYKKVGDGDRERALSSAMLRSPSHSDSPNQDNYAGVRRGFLDTISANAIKKASIE